MDIELTQEEAESLQDFVTDHINRCLNDIYEEEQINDGWEPYDLYCACNTCNTREYLMATFDWLRKNGKVNVYVG